MEVKMAKVNKRNRFRAYENFEDEHNRHEIIGIVCSCQGGWCHCFEKLLEQIELFKEKENRILTPVYVEIQINEFTGEVIEILNPINVILGDGE